MSREETIQKISSTGIVAVIRADNGEILADVTQALVDGGVTAIEVTFTVPKAHKVLEYVADRFGDQIQLGAGTVLDAETARIAILAGAEFIVSPIVDLPTIEISHRYDKAMMAGALTPTEVVKAWQAGSDVVKIFPSDLTGPSYLKSLKGPLPQVRMMPTGGVNLDTAEEFLKAGACALGVGGSLVEKSAIDSGNMDRIRDLARQYVEIVQRFRA
ncbi:2-dehydro-3-deoxyphosphogluconate aldolase [Blastopirellula marina]|uniref:2-dehydro-3-deoxyphosphogluconate aldolase n=1 Tax=Blastopirellula marina TaxID=124 RepID=A0A2S8GA47_9BACT|nr:MULTISPECIES: bifunctional 2-keto-4-hydroxyglutarate aldolase/2-keto-3-deoxy-6-phosphogluconate aldolase [Pirellulaceae]PQO41289.1 2-dehydro-3-deoxyphosphogluconate aldolase [Blastopirellula marina]RCS56313.1 bifunctional 4-hydroxy-2-oxoglutarate aldolase/2-dehydro-3-deoxy-phosphogluconate aldolase [Bremerella cremea]